MFYMEKWQKKNENIWKYMHKVHYKKKLHFHIFIQYKK